ncbi:hypothetical protein PVK06_027033 [Gossypium arboreum]|uniref:DUF7745 domain-containing protein n=1 Tax=Gossypium arboreum TaxID=29729 RepID=A0ABR0NZ93_GOSAR|nr:hypothetical protein PVK06_027033 [Gossypium arboreum]
MSKLSEYTRISVTQNNLRELKAIWDQWGNETKQSFYGKYGDLPYLFDIQVDENVFRALAQFWNPAYSCFTFGEALGYVDEATTDLFHRLSKWVTSVLVILAETFRSLNACRRASAGSFDWVILLGIWGTIGYVPLLVLRQHGLRQFTLGVVISPATTPKYVEWRGRRINDNIPKPSVEGARPIEEYLQVTPSELEIMKQEFGRKNLKLEKKIAKLEEEKMYLSLDVNVQKMEVEKKRKEKRKIDEDRDDLKKNYKKAQVALKRAGLGSRDSTVEVKKLKGKVEELEPALQDSKLLIEQLGVREDHLKGELHQSRGQVRERDHVIGEAVAQI